MRMLKARAHQVPSAGYRRRAAEARSMGPRTGTRPSKREAVTRRGTPTTLLWSRLGDRQIASIAIMSLPPSSSAEARQ